MRNTSVLHWTLLVALLASPVGASAQNTTDDQEPVASPPSPTITTAPLAVAQERAQTLRGDSEFRTLHNLVISADGAWMAAEERPDRGDGNVRVWSTERDLTFSIERGQNPRISRDSRWVSALQKPPLEDSRTATPKNKRAGQTLVLLDTQDGSRRTFDFVLSYDMTYASTYLLYLQSPETKADEEGPSKDEATKPATKPATKERRMGTLHQVPLHPARLARNGLGQPDRMYTNENVVEFATYPPSHHFAYMCCTTKRQVAIHSASSNGASVRGTTARRSKVCAGGAMIPATAAPAIPAEISTTVGPTISRSGSSSARRQQAKTGSGA